MSEPIETTGKLTIDGELIETANLVFHPLPENQCCRTQHENTKRAILKHIAQEYSVSVTYHPWCFSEAGELAKWIGELKLEDTQWV